MTIAEDAGAEGTGVSAPAPYGAPPGGQFTEADVATTIRRWPELSVGFVMRTLLFAAIVIFLGVYVGPSEIGSTVIKVAIAVALSAAVFMAANRLFDQAYGRWTLFNTLIGAVVGFFIFVVLDNDGALRTLLDEPVELVDEPVEIGGFQVIPAGFDLNPWVWGVIGGAALGLVVYLLSAPRQRAARMPLAVAGFAAYGVLLTVAINDAHRPELDWGKLVICAAVGVVVFGGLGLRKGMARAQRGALTGLALGWLVGAWGGAENIGQGSTAELAVAAVVPAVVIGFRVGLSAEAEPTTRRRIDQRSRSWIFLTPALVFVIAGLLIPVIRTFYLSFRSADSRENVGLDNYDEVFTSTRSFDLDNWTNAFTSRLAWIALAFIALGVLGGILSGRRTQQAFEKGPGSLVPIGAGFFLLACAILASARGTIMNNIWWIVVVTTLATVIGLAVAVLAERSRGEQFAKSLIFLPMAISFVGAGIIWRFVYQARDVSQEQTGVLNSVWVWVGEVSNSTAKKTAAVIVLLIFALFLALLVKRAFDTKSGMMGGFSVGLLIIVGYLVYRLLGPGLGGFETAPDGTVRARPVQFVTEPPFNNMWLMVVLIWIQTGFAMVILSSAIKAVPTELLEAATVDGATESQVFWRVTLPQIGPTIGVVITTLFVTVLKVFDIVRVMTGGQFGTEVIANEMFTRAFSQQNYGLGSALAVVLCLSALPVMYINIRRMQQARA